MVRRDDLGWPAGAAASLPTFGPPLPRFTVVIDLGERIGSPRWLRGFATLGAMIAALFHVAPGLPPLPAAMSPVLSAPAEEQMRAIGISPIAGGAVSGMRIAPTDRAQPLVATPERPRIDVTVTVRDGDDLAGLLVRAGAASGDADAAAALIAGAAPPFAQAVDVAITLGRRTAPGTARPIEAVSLRAALDLMLAVRRIDGRLTLIRTAIPVDDRPLRVTAAVGTSLYRTLRGAGVPLDAVVDYLQAIAKHVSVDEIAEGDRFDVVLAHRRAATGESETGRLLYAGLTHQGERLQLLRWTTAGHEQWLDAAGVGERREGLSLPVHGRLTSGFGMRFHPILGYSRMHQGIDLAAPYGTPIVAASDGVVSFAGWHGGHGNYVRIAHAAGMATGYGHMSQFVVAAGGRIRQGQVIGYVGSTGLSTGPHCHFEVFRNGVAIDPVGTRLSTASQVSGAELVRFRALLARYAALPSGRT